LTGREGLDMPCTLPSFVPEYMSGQVSHQTTRAP
jgi:hypothetical protein